MFERFFELSIDLLCIVDFDGYFRQLNPSFASLLSLPQEELMAKPFYEHIHPDDLEATTREMEKLRESDYSTIDFENRYRRGDGSYVWVSWTATKSADDELVFAIGHDITWRRFIEQRLRDIAYSSADWIWEVDGETRYTYCSERVFDVLGYTPEELQGRTPFELMPPEEEEEIRNRFAEISREMKPITDLENLAISKDGREVTLLTNGVPILDECGALMGYRGVDKDITARKKREKEYRSIVKTAMDGFWRVDLDGRFLDVNDAYCQLTGYSREELLGMAITDIEAMETPEMTARRIEGIIERGWDRFESRHRRKDGSEVDVEVSVNFSDIDEGSLFVFTRDISERKRAEAELQRINTELEGYAHSVSHDLRGPICSISLACRSLGDMVESCGVPDARRGMRDTLKILQNNIDRSSNLVEDLLALAEAGQVPDDVDDVDVRHLVEEIVEEKAGSFASEGITVDIAADLGCVSANPTHIYQLFANLIENAIMHNDSINPRISVARGAGCREGEHRFSVRDNGPGIPPGDIENIFTPFFKGKAGNTGIGLSIVGKIVRLYGGEISVRNDGGAVFEFSLKDLPR